VSAGAEPMAVEHATSMQGRPAPSGERLRARPMPEDVARLLRGE